MARPHTVLQSIYPYNISARCINREWFNVPMQRVWEIFCEELTRTNKELKLEIHTFVLMSNHFHLIASTPEANISDCMHQFMYRTSRQLTREGNRINETFAGRHFKCILQHHNYYLNAYKYNYRNPVMGGLCKLVEDYPYSTLQSVMKKTKALIPLAEDTTYLLDPKGTIDWLNRSPDLKKLDGFQKGLRHAYFKSRKRKYNMKPLISEHDIL